MKLIKSLLICSFTLSFATFASELSLPLGLGSPRSKEYQSLENEDDKRKFKVLTLQYFHQEQSERAARTHTFEANAAAASDCSLSAEMHFMDIQDGIQRGEIKQVNLENALTNNSAHSLRCKQQENDYGQAEQRACHALLEEKRIASMKNQNLSATASTKKSQKEDTTCEVCTVQ